MYGMSRCLRNSVRLRTCTGRWAIKFLGSASSATALVLRGYCYCIGTFTKMSTEIGDKKMNNINGGNTASKSSGGTFSGYTFILPILLDVSLLILFAMAALRYFVNVDAYFILSILKLYTSSTVTRSTHIANVMFIVLIFWIKICRIMTKFPTRSPASGAKFRQMISKNLGKKGGNALRIVVLIVEIVYMTPGCTYLYPWADTSPCWTKKKHS